MSIKCPILKPIVAAVCVTVMNTVPLAAQSLEVTRDAPTEQVAPDLQDEDALLAALLSAEKPAALRFDRQLQTLWSKSGSASADLLLKRGRDAMEVDKTRIAIEHLTALTDHAPDFAEGWHARASAYFAAELFGPALADLERALALNPRNYNAIFGLGTMLETFGDIKRAYEAYERVLALHPHHEDATNAAKRLGPQVQGTSL